MTGWTTGSRPKSLRSRSLPRPYRKIALAVANFYQLRSEQSCSAFSTPSGLSQAYRELARRANDLKRWPDSRKFCEDCLVYDKRSDSYRLPEFLDGHGSLGVFGFLYGNNAARSILTACDQVFNQFTSQIEGKILNGNQTQQAALASWIMQSPSTSHHISVAILQEHPSFLCDKEDLEKWKPISDSTIHQLAANYASDHPKLICECPSLQLESLLWTPDGALIAGFIDQSPDQEFEKLRQSSRTIARNIMGDVITTRPKTLIHATVGRVVGLPPGASDGQYKSLTDLACEFNEVILPRTVSNIREQTDHGGMFQLQDLALARNKIWMMQEYKMYASWPLVDGR